MGVTEKAAYLKGLIEGSELKLEPKEKKILDAVMELMGEMADTINDLAGEVDNLYDGYDAMSESIEAIEDDLDELFECGDCDCDDESYYDVECPKCGEQLCIDEETLIQGDVLCPNCGEKLEFDIDECECDCEDCCKDDEDKD